MATITRATVFGDAGTGGLSGVAVAPPYSGAFIPTIWAGKLIEKFYDATVLAAIANTDYEGEITSYGDKVVIRQKPNLSINPYTADATLSLQRPNSNTVELNIDTGKYFAAILDDVYEIQSDLDLLSLWADDASEQMKISIDTDVLNNVIFGSLDISADNIGGSAGRISGNIDLGVTASPLLVAKADIIDAIVSYGQVLDEQNIPETGRWLVVPAWFAAMIKRSELRDASLSGDGVSMLRNGRLGMIDRFTLYSSNLLPNGVASGLALNEFAVFAGHAHAFTFASQLTKMETIRAESTFGTIIRGLQVYGSKITDGTGILQSIVKAN